MKYFYTLLISLSVFFLWFITKNSTDSIAYVSFNKVAKPTPKKVIKKTPFKNFSTGKDLSVTSATEWHAPLVPNITLVKSVAVQGGGNATPGGQLNYSVVLSNTASGVANNATGVSFSDVLNSNLTLVASSVKATPIGVNDAYDVIGNVGITVPVGNGVLANDVSPDGTAITATVSTNVANGTLSLATSGSFTYTPNAGYSGTDSFIYTVTSTNGTISTNNTVTLTVSAPIWFVNIAAASNGNGTLASPFKDWSNFATANALTGATDPAANQTIFVYSGTYSGAAALKAGQKVLGQGATVGLASFAGTTAQTYTNALPSTSGTRPNLTSSGTTITLASGNTLRGFDMGNSTKDIVGSSFLTLTVSEMALNGNGAALDLSSGNLAANFTNISSTDAASDAISLISITGNLTNSGSTTITNPNGFGIGMALNSSLVSSFGNTTINGSSSVGVLITSLNAHTTTFGSLNIAPDANTNAIQIGNNAGTITCTSGTMSSTNITAVNIIGANSTSKVNLNMTLTSVSTSGGQRGILIKDAAGSFTVTGTGTTAGSGGTLNNHTLNGVDLNNVSNITLRNMTLSNANTTDATLSTTDYSVSNGGIIAKDVSGLTLNNVSIAGCVQRGISGHNVSNFSMTNCTVNNSGNNVNEGAIAFSNLSGTCSITGSSITRANEHLINIFNTSVNLNLTISNSTISDTQTTPAGTASAVVGTGILANTFGSGRTYITVSNCTLNKIGADAIKTINNDTSSGSYEITGCSIDPVNSVTQPNDVGTAIEITSNETSTVYTNIHDNTKLSANGGNVVTIAPTEQSTIHAKFINNLVTYKTGGIVGVFRGIEIFGQDDARGYATITGNNISGLPQSNGIMVDNRSTLPTHAGNGRIDAIITGNNVALNYPDPNSTGRCIFLEAGNTSSSQNIVCARVASNTTSNNGINGHFRLSSFGTNSAVRLEGSTDATTAWNSSNTPTTGANGGIVSVRSGSVVTMVAANTCIAPLDPPAFVAQLADNNQTEEISNENARLALKNEHLKDSLTAPETLSIFESKQTEIPTDDLVINATQNSVADVNAGETVTIAGAGSGFTLPAGKSTTITFSATISNSPSTCAITNTASVAATGITTVNSNTTTTNVVVPAPTAVTPSSATPICTGQSVSLVATCSSGTVQWYNAAATGTLLGTSTSLGTFTQSPTTNTTYQAACIVGGCESTRVNTGLITVNPLPTITVSASPAICEGATTFTIPFTATTGTPTTYSISGTGITTVTNAALPATPITVNLSSAATGSSYSYTLTVRNANGCVSSNVTGSVNVSPVPTITTQASPAICAGATSFTIPFTTTTGTPTTYSISGTGITTVTNGTLTTSPIVVNLSAGASGSSISYTLTVRNEGGCTSSNVTGSVTVNPLPTLTQSASPAICAGATSFTIPYSATTGTPTTYSISGTGITTVTDVTLPATPISVNLSSGASGSSISYTLTVKNANGCTSSNIIGNVTVNTLPTLTKSASPAICAGTTSFVIPYTATTGTPTTYSISGTGITTVTDAALPATPITVNISDVGGATGSSYSYILTVKNANGCTSSNITGSVTVNSTPAPTSPTATPSNFTVSGTTTLNATGCNSPSTITWYDAANSTVALPNNTPTISANKTFFARCTGTNTCISDPSTNVSVTYNPCTPLGSSPGNVNITWTGLLSTDWNTACNWNPAWVPDLTNNKVIIPNTTNKPIISSSIPDVKTIEVQSGATLTINSGQILNIRGDGGVNKGLTINGGTVTNNGTINVESSTNTAIAAYIYLQSGNAVLTNNGTIKINSTDEAIGVGSVVNPATITNNSTGIINIVNGIGVEIALPSDAVNFSNAGIINYNGAVLAFKFLGTTIFTNTGSVNINSGTGIENPVGNTINNNACGKILMASGTYTNGGTTTNAGLIQMPNALTSTGTFTNNGVIKSNTGVSGVTNNKMLISNTCPIFTLGGSNNYTVSGIFTDAGATTSAGTYTLVGNKFTANNTIPTGTQTLYAQVTDGTCTFVVPFVFNNVKPTAVSINTTNICVGSSITLAASCASGTVTWYGSATGTTSLGTGGTFSYIPSAGTGQSFYASCESTNCISGRTITSNTVNVNAIPNPPSVTLTSASVVCSPSSLTLTASACAGTVTWSQGGATGTSLTLSAIGTYSITATCMVNGCTSSASSAVNGLQVKAQPTVPTSSNQNICSGTSATLTANCTIGNIVWYASATATSGTAGSPFTTPTLTSPTSYFVACESGGSPNCASNRVQVDVTITSIPNPPSASNANICYNTAASLTATCSTGSVVWYGSATATSGTAGSPLITPPLTTNTSYFVACEVGSCASNRTQVNVIILPQIPDPVTSNVTACNGTSATLTASCPNGNIAVWYSSTTATTPLLYGSEIYNTPVLNSPQNYYVECERGGSPNCKSNRIVVAVSINANPSSPTGVTPSASICSGNNTMLVATCTGNNVMWYASATASSGTANSPFTTPTLTNATASPTITSYFVACESGGSPNCVSSRTQVDVTVKPIPSVPTITPPASLVVCSPATLTLTANGCAGTVNWSNGTTGSSLILTSVGTYSISATCTINGCTSDASTAVNGMEIKAKPTAPTITPPASLSVCSPATLTLTANGCAGTVNWSNGTSGTTLILSTVGTYAISATCAVNGCTSDPSTPISLQINQKPVVSAGTDQVTCAGTPVSLVATCNLYSISTNLNGASQVPPNASTATGNVFGILNTLTNQLDLSLSFSGLTGGNASAAHIHSGAATANGPVIISFTGFPSATSGTYTNTFTTLSPTNTAAIVAGNTYVNIHNATFPGGEIRGQVNATCIANTYVWNPVNLSGQTVSVSPITTTTYTVTATNSTTGCSATATTVVNVNPKPTAPTITPPPSLSVCSPATLTLTANGCDGTVNWSNGTSGTTLILSTVGTYSLSATCTINGCTSDASTAVNGLEIKAKPTAPTITPPASLVVCSPATLTLTANGCAGTVNWSNGASGTTLILSTVGTYAISATCTINGCTSDASTAVNGLEIKAKPTAPTITPPPSLSVCSPATLTLTANGCDGTVNWSNGTSGTTLILSTVGTYSLSATCTINGCTSDASTAVNGLEIKAKPTAPTITPPASLVVCSPTTLTLTANGCAGSVNWSNGASGTTLILSTVGTYSLSATCTINGCTSDASAAVNGLEIKAKPTAPTITPPASLVVCSPATLTLTANGCAGTVNWSNGASGTTLILSTVGTYSLSATCTINGCTSDASAAVNGLEIKAKPTAPTITPPASLVVCSPATLTLTANGCAGTVNWSNGASGTTLILSTVGTYSLSATCTINGCTSDASAAVNGLEIKAKPTAPTITPPASLVVCSPATLTLTANGCAGTVNWSNGASGTTLILSTVGTYSLSATCTINGCTSDASTAVNGLEIKAKPTAPTITPPASLVVCSPATLTLTANGCAGSVNWSNGASGTTLILSTVGTYSLSATCTINGCTSDASTAVTGLEIKAKPTAPTITPPASLVVCSPATLTLTANGCDGTVNWSNGTSGTTLILSTVGTYTISATCTVNGCTSDASTAVNGLEIKAKPATPTITPPAQLVVCSPSTLILSVSGCAGTVNWSNGASGTTLILSTVGTYSLSATCTINGCTSDASAAVNGLEIKAKPTAPTITPPASLVVCSPATLTLTANGCAGTVNWSNGASGTTLILSTVGTYSLSATCTINGCTSDASTAVNGLEIKAKPTAPTITPPASLVVCSPATLTLTANGCAGSVNWSNGASGTTLILSTVGTYAISATCTINGCTSDASTAVTGLEIKQTPIITATNTGPYTVNQTINLTGTGGGTYNWSGPNNFTSNSSNPSITNALSVNGGIYTLTVVGVNGCIAIATTNVIVNGVDPCDPNRIVDYLYVKAGNPYQSLFPLTSGMVINQRSDLVSILVSPSLCPTVTIESFEMNIQGPELNWNILQNVAPNALFDNFGPDVWGRNFVPGNYTLTVTGYAQDNKGGGITYGPKIITFTVVGNLTTINAPTLSKTSICAGSTVDVTFATSGLFNGANQFHVELSDSSGSFAAPVLIGTSNSTGTLSCTIPPSTFEGAKYLIRVTSTNQVVISNPAISLVRVYPFNYNLVSPTDNLTGISTKKATSTINANNKITSPANVIYQAGNSILLTPGFESGAVFKAEIQGCSN